MLTLATKKSRTTREHPEREQLLAHPRAALAVVDAAERGVERAPERAREPDRGDDATIPTVVEDSCTRRRPSSSVDSRGVREQPLRGPRRPTPRRPRTTGSGPRRTARRARAGTPTASGCRRPSPPSPSGCPRTPCARTRRTPASCAHYGEARRRIRRGVRIRQAAARRVRDDAAHGAADQPHHTRRRGPAPRDRTSTRRWAGRAARPTATSPSSRRAGWSSRSGAAPSSPRTAASPTPAAGAAIDAGAQRPLAGRRSTRCSTQAARGRRRGSCARAPRRPGAATRASSCDPDGHPWEVAHNPRWTIARRRQRHAALTGGRSARGRPPAERDQLARHVRLVGVAGGERRGRQRLAGAHAARARRGSGRCARTSSGRSRRAAVKRRRSWRSPSPTRGRERGHRRGGRAREPRAPRRARAGPARPRASRGAQRRQRARPDRRPRARRLAAGAAPEVLERRRGGRAARRPGRRAPRRRRPGGGARRRGRAPRAERDRRPGRCPGPRRARARRATITSRQPSGRTSGSRRRSPARSHRQRTTWARSGGGRARGRPRDNGCATLAFAAGTPDRGGRPDAPGTRQVRPWTDRPRCAPSRDLRLRRCGFLPPPTGTLARPCPSP